MNIVLTNRNRGTQINLVYAVEILLIAWLCFFSYLDIFTMTQYSAILKILLVSVIPLFDAISRPKIPQIRVIYYWLLYLLVFVVGILFSNDIVGGIAWSIQKICIFLILSYLYKNQDILPKLFDLMLVFSLVHVFATILEFVSPNIIHSIDGIILSGNDYNTVLRLFSYGYHCGIVNQASYNACFITVSIVCVFGKILCHRNKRIINLTLLLLSMVALILTGKRGMVVAAFFGIIVSLLIFLHFKKGLKIGYIVLILFTFSVIYWLIINTDIAANIIRRFSTEELNLSNRDQLWSIAWAGITKHPIIGNGTMTFSDYSTSTAHNCFLQIWFENGIIGLISVFLIMIGGVSSCIRILKNCAEDSDKMIVICSLCYQVFFIVSCATDSYFYHNILLVAYVFFTVLPFSVMRLR